MQPDKYQISTVIKVPHLTSGWRWLFQFHDRTLPSLWAPAGQRETWVTTRRWNVRAHFIQLIFKFHGDQVLYLVGTGTSVRAPSMTACCRRTNATKGVSRKSTSPTSTFDASASRGNFFMNLFFSCWSKRRGKKKDKSQTMKMTREGDHTLKNSRSVFLSRAVWSMIEVTL